VHLVKRDGFYRTDVSLREHHGSADKPRLRFLERADDC